MYRFIWMFSLIVFFCSCNSNEQKKVAGNSIITHVDSFAIKEKRLSEDSLNLSLREELAISYYQHNNLNKAIYHLTKLCELDSTNIAPFINLGNVLYDSRNYSEAIKYYEKALEYDSLNTNVRCDLATCYLNINNAEKALLLLKENIKLDYNHLQSHHNISIVYENLGRTDDAINEKKIFNSLSENNNNLLK